MKPLLGRYTTTDISIWFEIWGSWIRVKNSNFPGKFPENFDFLGNFTKKIRFSRQKLVIYSYFWKNYSISLQQSPLSKYFLYMIRYNILRPSHDPRATTPCDPPNDPPAQNLVVATPHATP